MPGGHDLGYSNSISPVGLQNASSLHLVSATPYKAPLQFSRFQLHIMSTKVLTMHRDIEYRSCGFRYAREFRNDSFRRLIEASGNSVMIFRVCWTRVMQIFHHGYRTSLLANRISSSTRS